MLTTMVENYPGYREGIMGPELMAEMRAQAEKFGAEIIQGNVTKVDLCAQPFSVQTSEQTYAGRSIITATSTTAVMMNARWVATFAPESTRYAAPAASAAAAAIFFVG